MGKKPAARQPSPMWVTTADLPTSAGHPFFERLNRVLEEAGFDAFVEGLCAVFYASRLGRPSLRPGRYFRLLFIGYFEGLSSERGIAWRVADSLSLRAFLDLDVTEAPPNHSTLSRTRRLIDVETHVAVFTWVLERLAGAGLVQGKTVGVDATTLEANAAMRSIERRDTGESYEAFVRQLAKASESLACRITTLKDGPPTRRSTGVDLETGATSREEASEGDSATGDALSRSRRCTGCGGRRGGRRQGVPQPRRGSTNWAASEPERGRRCWQQEDGRDAGGEACCAEGTIWEPSAYSRDRSSSSRAAGSSWSGLSRTSTRPGGCRVWVRGHENRKRVLIQPGCNLGLLLRRLTGVGTGACGAGSFGHLRTDRSPTALWGRLTASWDFQWTPAGLVGSIAHRQAANRPAQRTDFFQGC